jgi:hypothetical protein
VVTAVIPESAVGFRIDTSAAHVVDLGTSFGMAVDEEGQTKVCVFEGKVEVSLPNQKLSHFARLVHEGQAVRVHRKSGTLNSVTFETGPFETAWPISSGVLQATGSMRFVPPGPNINPGNYPDDEHIVVFPERRGVELRTDIRVNLVDPGEYNKRQPETEKKTLSAGQRLTSYLLQFDAETPGSGPHGKHRMTGQISFTRRIAGVITTNPLLMKSERVFKDSVVEYKVTRGIEPRPAGDERVAADTVILTPDQRTLILDLYVGDIRLDQIRVLVFDEEKKL